MSFDDGTVQQTVTAMLTVWIDSLIDAMSFKDKSGDVLNVPQTFITRGSELSFKASLVCFDALLKNDVFEPLYHSMANLSYAIATNMVQIQFLLGETVLEEAIRKVNEISECHKLTLAFVFRCVEKDTTGNIDRWVKEELTRFDHSLNLWD